MKKSVFYTGAAGTGKSFILQILKEVVRKLDCADMIAFTAPTGVAACNVSGLTIHSWAGVGLAKEPLEILVGMVKGNRFSGNCRTNFVPLSFKFNLENLF